MTCAEVVSASSASSSTSTCGSAGVTGACEDEENSVVNPGTGEVNPLHVPGVDLVGHRYHTEDSFGFVIGVQGQLLF